MLDYFEPGMTPELWAELTGEEMSDAEKQQQERLDFIIDTIVALGEGRINQDQFASRMDVLDAIDRGAATAIRAGS